MARAKERRLILPDALLSSTRKPGPAQRQLPGYRELSEALRTKQMISEWELAAHSSSRIAELQLREALTRSLSDHGYFGYIRPDSKLPQSHPKPSKQLIVCTEAGTTDFLRPNGTDWLGASTAPGSGNWSVIPKTGGRLMVFDLDVRKTVTLPGGEGIDTTPEQRYLEVRRSIGYLELILGMDLRNTYAQLSPSGGVHIFVLLPAGVDPRELPSAKISDGMRSLAGIEPESWKVELRGDIRSGASNGFILMAGSQLEGAEGHYRPLATDPRWADFKDYRSGRKLRLLELTEAAVQRLREAKALDLQLRATPRAEQPKITADELIEVQPRRLGRELKPESYSRLLKRLELDQPESFHEARAQIYRALSCCGSPESIARICREAGYGRDSHRSRELSDGELLADMEAMDRRGLSSSRCGSHCGSVAMAISPMDSARSQELEILNGAILADKLNGAVLSTLGHRRAQDSALLEARAILQLRDQREGDFGVYGRRNPLGFDYRSLTIELLGEQNFRRMIRGEALPVAGYRLRALELAVSYFGPLFSAGASVAIAPARELMGLFGWSQSQLREALRLLRSSGVIALKRRQISGRTSGYGPGDSRFYDPILSRKLRSAWGLSRVANGAGESAFLGGFFDYGRGRIVRPDGSSYTDGYLREVGGSFTGLLEELSICLPRASRIGRSIVSRYLGKSLVRYLKIQSTEDQASETVRELKGDAPAGIPPLNQSFIEFSPDLWTSRSAPRKDRATGHSSNPMLLRSQHGDRSPPDGQQNIRRPNLLAKIKRKPIDAT